MGDAHNLYHCPDCLEELPEGDGDTCLWCEMAREREVRQAEARHQADPTIQETWWLG